MKNRYQELTEAIHTPAGLNDRVLFEARRRTAEAGAPPRREGQRWRRPFLRTAVCAVCALALVLEASPSGPRQRRRPRPPEAPGGRRLPRCWCPPSA